MYVSYKKYTLNFKFLAGTSRGALQQKDSYFIKIAKEKNALQFGIGECSLLRGLSVDDIPDYETQLAQCCKKLEEEAADLQSEQAVLEWVDSHIDEKLPSIRFGFEMALLDLINGGKRQLLENPWSQIPYQPIIINGLVWMNTKEHMLEQVREKIQAGFDCIKIKIGAIDFEEELSLLHYIRDHYTADEITIRVDANGAFEENDVFYKLEKLAEFEVHSIEQPVSAGQPVLMRKVCAHSPVPVALDEELIGVNGLSPRTELIDQILPQFIILKPSLLGGISACREWIRIAEERSIAWWVTSALESNIGLNAIAQFTASYPIKLPQGLGTGQLYHNNIDSPLLISEGKLHYDMNSKWDIKPVIE